MDLSGTFDTTNALSGMFLWIIFGYLATMLNCDLQRFISMHPLFVHFMGLTAFFFLFTILDSQNKSSLNLIYLKTVLVYALFVMMTKSKWYFVVPVLMLLLVDQATKKQLAFDKAGGKDTSSQEERQEAITRILNVMIIVLIVIGTLHYMYLQYIEYGDKFSYFQFFFGMSKCKRVSPNYNHGLMFKKIKSYASR